MKKDIGKWLAILGALLLCALPIGILTSFASLISAFHKVNEYGASNPEMMATEISSALVATVLGLLISFPGIIVVFLSITIFKYREKWIYWVSVFSLILVMLHIPIGTVLGLIMLGVLIVKRNLFLAKV